MFRTWRTGAFWLAVALILVTSCARQEETASIRIGLEAVGTFSWVIYAMQHYGIDRDLGLDLNVVTYPTKAAKELALRGGGLDVLVDDFLAVTRWREEGHPVRAVQAYSTATGGLVVPVGSDIRSVEDLKGRTVGVTSFRDKSVLILRAMASSRHGFDPRSEAEMMVAAPPLMEALMARGQLDAAVPPWHIASRMVGSGEYREIATTREMLANLRMSPELPLLVVVARDDLDPVVLRNFLEGLRRAVTRMEEHEVWDLVLAEELYSLPDRSLFPAVVERWRLGVPTAWNREVVRGLSKLTDMLVDVAGADVVGVDSLRTEAFAPQ